VPVITGGGFAVVADEVRGLACRTKGSIDEIRSTIESLELNVKSAVHIVNTGVGDAKESLKENMMVSHIIDEIFVSIVGFTEMCERISTVTGMQRMCTNQAAEYFTSLEDSLSKTIGLIQVAGQNTKEIAAISHKLQGTLD